jgi:archaetidylinositol phosphate synthase
MKNVFSDIHKHYRVNDILLGPLERPALRWLAAHMPAWVTSDICTLTGVAGAIVILLSYFMSRYSPYFLWLASLGFVINWLGDSLDGTLARYRHTERPIYGFFIDHTVDAVNEVVIFLGLGLSPYVSFPVACLALIAYLLLSVLIFVRTCVAGEFKISYGRLGPTEIRVLAILLNTVMFFVGVREIPLALGTDRPFMLNPYDLIVGAIAIILATFFLVTVVQETRRLAKAGE